MLDTPHVAADITGPRVGKRGAPQAFARKLYEILTTESAAVIDWNKGGTAFHVKDVDTFSEQILTKYYRHSKFSSFQRQLNLYAFRKIVKGPDAGGYAHPMFRRGRPDDLYHVRRSISGSGKYEAVGIDSSRPSAAATSRRSRGRAAAKAGESQWAPRALKSRASARRVGKFRYAALPHRRDYGGDASSGEHSPFTTGESASSSDEAVSSCGEESDFESDAGEEEAQNSSGASSGVPSAVSTDGVSELSGPFSPAVTADDLSSDPAVTGGSSDVAGGGALPRVSGPDEASGNEATHVPARPPSPSRIMSPFRFFKSFSFMDKSPSRGLSTSSGDMSAEGGAGVAAPGAGGGSKDAADDAPGANAIACGPQHHLATRAERTPASGSGEGNKDVEAAASAEAAAKAKAAMPPPPKREPKEELGLVEQLTNMVEVFDICDLLRRVSSSSRSEKPGQAPAKASPQHLRNMSVDTDAAGSNPGSPHTGEGSGLPSLASMELTRDSSRDWDTLMAGSAEMSDLGNSMVQSVAEFFSF